MSREFILFCCACCILVLTTINLSIGNVISGNSSAWGQLNCAQYEDEYDIAKKNNLNDKAKDSYKKIINRCKNLKGFHDMEYTSFIFDIAIGLICWLLGLLQIFSVNIPKIGLISLICGIIGFILTFVYVILNGIVLTDTSYEIKRDSDGSFLEWDETASQYKFIFFDEDDEDAIYAKYSELNLKQYNYDKDYYFNSPKDVENCQVYLSFNPDGFSYDFSTKITYSDGGSDHSCNKIYFSKSNTITNKDRFDRFLTTLLLSLFVCLANVGLVFFGFLLLFKSQTGASQSETTKIVKFGNN